MMILIMDSQFPATSDTTPNTMLTTESTTFAVHAHSRPFNSPPGGHERKDGEAYQYCAHLYHSPPSKDVETLESASIPVPGTLAGGFPVAQPSTAPPVTAIMPASSIIIPPMTFRMAITVTPSGRPRVECMSASASFYQWVAEKTHENSRKR